MTDRPSGSLRAHFFKPLLWIVLCLIASPTNGQFSYTRLKSFGDDGGTEPQALFEASDGMLYGVCDGIGMGTNYSGGVFRMKKDGSGFKILRKLTLAEGSGLNGLAEAGNGKLCGTTSHTGEDPDPAKIGGTVFTLNKDGSDFRIVHHFVGTFNPNTGSLMHPLSPIGSLLASWDGSIYGVCSAGVGGNGVFKCTFTPNEAVQLLLDLAEGCPCPGNTCGLDLEFPEQRWEHSAGGCP
jgi:hypothetical protein